MTQNREWSSMCSRRFPGADTLGVMRRFVGPTLELRGRSRARVRFLSGRGGLPADAGAFLVVEAVESVWRRGLDLDGSRTVLGARGSDFRFPDRGPRAALCVWPR